MVAISRELKIAIKLGAVPAYKIAHQANLDPSTFSKIICGIIKIKPNDPRVIAIGRVLGIPETECFSEEMENDDAIPQSEQ